MVLLISDLADRSSSRIILTFDPLIDFENWYSKYKFKNLFCTCLKIIHFRQNFVHTMRGIYKNQKRVNSPHKDQWRGACLICTWTNGWVNNRDASDLRRRHAHYDITIMHEWKGPLFCFVEFYHLITTAQISRSSDWYWVDIHMSQKIASVSYGVCLVTLSTLWSLCNSLNSLRPRDTYMHQ